MDEVIKEEQLNEINTHQEQQQPLEQSGMKIQVDEKTRAYQQELERHTQSHQTFLDNRRSNGEEDSAEMQQIKACLRTVNDKMMLPMDPDYEVYKEQLRDLHRDYKALIAACDVYIDSHFAWLWGEARRRKNLVKRLKQSAKQEMGQFRHLQGDHRYHRERSAGMLVGHALGHAVRDYAAYQYTFNKRLENLRKTLFSSGEYVSQDNISTLYFISQAKKKDWRVTDAVGTYRFAEYLDLTNGVQMAGLMMIKDRNDEIHYGKRVNLAYQNQFTLKELRRKHDKADFKLVYSTRAIRRLSQIKLFSLLMGRAALDETEDIMLNVADTEEVDGKTVYHVDGAMLKLGKAQKTNVIKKVTNDDGEERTDKVRLRPEHVFTESEDPEIIGQQINTLRLELGLDDVLSDTIKLMDEEDIRYAVGDLVTKNEMRVFNRRLQYIKEELQKYASGVRVNKKGHPDHQDEEVWNTEQNLAALQHRLTGGENNPVMTFGALFQGHEVEIERQLTDEELADRQALKKAAEEEEEEKKQERKKAVKQGEKKDSAAEKQVKDVRKKMASLQATFQKKYGDREKMDADMEEWLRTVNDEKINQQVLGESCRKRLMALDQFYIQTRDLHDRNPNISAKELDKDEEIAKMYAFMKEMERERSRHLTVLYDKILPAYEDRVEKLCIQIAKKHDIDKLMEDFTEQKEKAFLMEWQEAKKQEINFYDKNEWEKKEKTFIEPLRKFAKTVEKARTDPSITWSAFHYNKKKNGKPTHAKVMGVYKLYTEYLAKKKEMIGT